MENYNMQMVVYIEAHFIRVNLMDMVRKNGKKKEKHIRVIGIKE